MGNATVIRRASEEDLEAIARINRSVFLGDRDCPAGALEWIACMYRAFPRYQYFVIEEGGVVVGYAGWELHGGFHRAEPVVELDQVGIDTAYQGKRLGPLLMGECVRELVNWVRKNNDRVESHVAFVVWVYAFNFNALAAYARLFGEGVCGLRTQFGDRAESMLRRRVPVIMPVRE